MVRKRESSKDSEEIHIIQATLASLDLKIGHFLEVIEVNILLQPARVFLTSQ
jgi:hypothetical protein